MTRQPRHEQRRYVRLEQGHILRHEKYVLDMTGEQEMVEEGINKDFRQGGGAL